MPGEFDLKYEPFEVEGYYEMQNITYNRRNSIDLIQSDRVAIVSLN